MTNTPPRGIPKRNDPELPIDRPGETARSRAPETSDRGASSHGSPDDLYRLLVESVQDYAIFALDPAGLILTWSAGAARLKGYARTEAVGQHFSIFYTREDVRTGKPQRELAVAARAGRVEDEGWRVRKDGTRFWANVVITALRDEMGTLVGFAKVTRDLTERRRHEDVLRQSEERFRLLVESVRDYAIFMLDPEGQVATWNAGAERIKGYQPEEIVGRHFSIFYPEDKVAERFPQYELEVATREGRFEDEGWRVRKDGSRFWANVVITALRNADGQLIGFAKVTRDLTDRRASEEQARRLAAEEAARTEAERQREGLLLLNEQLQNQAIELEQQTEEAQALAEELEQTNEELHHALDDANSARVAAERAAAALAESERQFHTLADTIPTLAWTAQPDGYIDWYNARWYEYTGTRPEQMAGWGWEVVHDAAVLPDVVKRWSASIATGEAFEMTFPLRGANGRFRRFLTRVTPVKDIDGRVVRWFGTNTDVEVEREARDAERAARAEAETARARLTQVFEQAPVAVAVVRGRTARDLVYELVNPRYEEIIPPGRRPMGRRIADVLPEASDELFDALQRVLDTGEPFVAVEFPASLDRDNDGTSDTYYFNFVYHPLVEADATVSGVVGIGTEVTESVRARHEAERLREAAERALNDAEAASSAKTEFLTMMSHELRTPLNAIAGYVQLLEMGLRGPVTVEQRQDLERIQRSRLHLTGLINEVLNYARLEAGAVTYDLRPTLIADVVAQAAPLIEPQRTAKRLALDVRLPELAGREPLYVLADRDKLEQILLNLLSNAVKFTYEGGRVTVELLDRPGDRGMAVLRVSDTGIGIPADKLEAIFEPFVQVGRSLSSPGEGTGLGLSISRDLARGMGGELTAESQPGSGSTFILTLPRA